MVLPEPISDRVAERPKIEVSNPLHTYRYHYKTRYDFRLNLVDWDYQMNLKEYAPIIHFYHYREWR